LVLGEQLFLARDAQLLVYLVKLDQQLWFRLILVQGQDGAVHGDGAAVCKGDVQFPLGKGVVGAQGGTQALLHILLGTRDKVAGLLAQNVARADVEQHLTGRVDVDEAQRVVKEQHGRVEVVEYGFFHTGGCGGLRHHARVPND
jgi:hypothetical protein